MTDIDTQIEDKLDTGLKRLQAHAITLGYYIDHPDQVKYREQAHKAIKTLLDTAVQEARIDILEEALWYAEPTGTIPEAKVGHILSNVVRGVYVPNRPILKSTSKEDK